MRIILASQSIFRKKALDILGLKYEVAPVDIDEKSIRDKDYHAMVRKIAEAKAREAGKKFSNSLIICGDLIVSMDGKVYEKPADKEEAVEMLKTFIGKEVKSIAAAVVYNSSTGKMLSATDEDATTFRKNLNEREIRNYVDRYPVTRFAGGFDHDGAILLAEKHRGNITILLGFPFNKVIEFLRENGVEC